MFDMQEWTETETWMRKKGSCSVIITARDIYTQNLAIAKKSILLALNFTGGLTCITIEHVMFLHWPKANAETFLV